MSGKASQLALISQARHALAAARTLDDIKVIRDKAEALRRYLRAQRDSAGAFIAAAEIKVRAERKAGEFLRETVSNGRPQKVSSTVTLSDIGVSRNESSKWQHVAEIPEATFEAFIATAVEAQTEPTTAAALRLRKNHSKASRVAEATAASSAPDLRKLAKAGQKFGTIYADPPWRYGNQATRASTDNHYPTMTPEQIAALPVRELAAERSHLWLWTTNGFLFECPRIFDAWGFEFKSSYVWVKPQFGIGNYLRNAHELLLLAVRGGLVGAARDVRSWGQFDRGAHSAKPEAIRRDVIERVSPGPRLELFGRKLVDGWTVWGNQIERTMFDTEAA